MNPKLGHAEALIPSTHKDSPHRGPAVVSGATAMPVGQQVALVHEDTVDLGIRQPSTHALVEVAMDAAWKARREAISALLALGSDAIPHLVTVARSDNQYVCEDAMNALDPLLASLGDDAVPVYNSLLSAPNGKVFSWATFALAKHRNPDLEASFDETTGCGDLWACDTARGFDERP